MLWNWETIDTCLISRQWHIASTAQFAASCLGVIVLAMSLQLLRRLTKEYDSRLLKHHQQRIEHVKSNSSETSNDMRRSGSSISVKMTQLMQRGSDPTRFRPNLAEQLTRALMHVGQFIVAYFVML
jgi:copper transporter 1